LNRIRIRSQSSGAQVDPFAASGYDVGSTCAFKPVREVDANVFHLPTHMTRQSLNAALHLRMRKSGHNGDSDLKLKRDLSNSVELRRQEAQA